MKREHDSLFVFALLFDALAKFEIAKEDLTLRKADNQWETKESLMNKKIDDIISYVDDLISSIDSLLLDILDITFISLTSDTNEKFREICDGVENLNDDDKIKAK